MVAEVLRGKGSSNKAGDVELGDIIETANSKTSAGHVLLPLDGSVQDKTQYPKLFDALGDEHKLFTYALARDTDYPLGYMNYGKVVVCDDGRWIAATPGKAGRRAKVSTDEGRTWVEQPPQTRPTADPSHEEWQIAKTGTFVFVIFYPGTHFNIYTSTDYGVTWHRNISYNPGYSTSVAYAGELLVSDDGTRWVIGIIGGLNGGTGYSSMHGTLTATGGSILGNNKSDPSTRSHLYTKSLWIPTKNYVMYRSALNGYPYGLYVGTNYRAHVSQYYPGVEGYPAAINLHNRPTCGLCRADRFWSWGGYSKTDPNQNMFALYKPGPGATQSTAITRIQLCDVSLILAAFVPTGHLPYAKKYALQDVWTGSDEVTWLGLKTYDTTTRIWKYYLVSLNLDGTWKHWNVAGNFKSFVPHSGTVPRFVQYLSGGEGDGYSTLTFVRDEATNIVMPDFSGIPGSEYHKMVADIT